jgi:pimeloyl-ACP methyl ester carboxylesterase
MARTRLIVAVAIVLGTSSVASAGPPGPADRPPMRAKATTDLARRAPAAWRAPARATATPAPCGDGSPFLCGSVTVPLDRANPSGRTIDIAFQILPAGDPTSVRPDPIFISEGGPGFPTTGSRDFWGFYALASLTDTRDLVMIDQRGTGGSGAIFCRDLQNGWNSVQELRRAIRRCGRSLGDDADRYGTGDIALDIEAVRRALGYDRINYVAGSYGTVVQQAYASRFPERVRAMVADAGLPVTDPPHAVGWGLDAPSGFVRGVVLACERAPSCAAEHPDPAALFDALAARLGADPVSGRARDAHGNLRRVTIDQTGLAFVVSSGPPNGGALNQGEIAAATVALLEHGDEAPLLRLGAESLFWPGDGGDPQSYSAGANWATWCNDVDHVFDRLAPRAVRRQQYADGRAALPDDTFAPFTIEAWEGFWWPDVCIQWPRPNRFVPAVPTGPPIDVPVLVLEGDIDTVVPMETTDRMAARFADPVIVRLQGGSHINLAWSIFCGQPLADEFIRTLQVGDTSCAEDTFPVFQAVDRFPRTSRGALEASPLPGDGSTARDRRAAWSTVKTVLDAWFRSFRQPEPVADGAGLRGGWFHADYSGAEGAFLVLHGTRFVRDIAVRGRTTFSYDFENRLLAAHVFIRGRGTGNGELRMESAYWFDTQFGAFRITGEIGGRHIELTMPGN